MNRTIPAVLLSVACCGCTTKPVTTTEVQRPTTSSVVYRDFVARRTMELQRMGGPFAEGDLAEWKARQEATARYGEVLPDVSTTWSWGPEARRKQAQATVTDSLEKMDRDDMRR